jgi:hypothetical protein
MSEGINRRSRSCRAQDIPEYFIAPDMAGIGRPLQVHGLSYGKTHRATTVMRGWFADGRLTDSELTEKKGCARAGNH